MKKFILTILTISATLSVMAGGRIVKGSVKSQILGVEKPYSVYLPEGYDNSKES